MRKVGHTAVEEYHFSFFDNSRKLQKAKHTTLFVVTNCDTNKDDCVKMGFKSLFHLTSSTAKNGQNRQKWSKLPKLVKIF